MNEIETYQAKWMYLGDWHTGAGFHRDGYFEVEDKEYVTISFGPPKDREPNSERDSVVDFGEAIVIPGLVNAHSALLERTLRGWGDSHSRRREIIGQLGPDEFEVMAEMAFLEMLRAGITHVGEFHTLHHRPDGREYDDANEMALRMGRAASQAGIRLTLFPVARDANAPPAWLGPEGKRGTDSDVSTYQERVRDLVHRWSDEDLLSVGLAIDDLRTVPESWVKSIADFAYLEKLPIHLHLYDSPQEVESCRQTIGFTPVEAIHEWVGFLAPWRLIHAAHLTRREIDILGQSSSPIVIVCPGAEKLKNHGLLATKELVDRRIEIAVATDTNGVIDLFEEVRSLEEHEQLCTGKPVMFGAATNKDTNEDLWRRLTQSGATALCGRTGGNYIAPGYPVDFIVVNADKLDSAEVQEQSLKHHIGANMVSGDIRDVCVDGEFVVRNKVHRSEADITARYQAMMASHSWAPESE